MLDLWVNMLNMRDRTCVNMGMDTHVSTELQ